MATQEELIHWGIRHAEALSLKVIDYQWTRKWMTPYWDLSVSIELDGKRHFGRAITSCGSLSFAKGLSSAIESAVVSRLKLSCDSGVSAHSDEQACARDARIKFASRDWFHGHLLGRTPFSLHSPGIELSDGLKPSLEMLRSQGVEFEFRWSSSQNDCFTALCVALGQSSANPFECLIGLGSGPTLKQALDAAFTECARDTIAWLEPSSQPQIRSSCQRLATDSNYCREIKKLLCPVETSKSAPLPLDELSVVRLPLDFAVLRSAPIVVYRAYLTQPIEEEEALCAAASPGISPGLILGLASPLRAATARPSHK